MRLSLVIPSYNGGESLSRTVDAALTYLRGRGEESELIVVDDGSVDGSGAALSAAGQRPGLRLLRSAANRGKGHAVREGVLQAQGERVIFTDADLAYPLGDIDKLLAALDGGADLAIADRTSPESLYHMSPAFFSYLYTRHVLSRLFNLAVRGVLGLAVHDCQAGLKGFRRSAAQAIFRRLTVNGFTFDVEVLYLAKRLGLNVLEVPVEFRYFSEPTTVAFMRDGVASIRDLVRIRLNARRGLYL